MNSTQFEILYGGHDTNAFGLAKRGVNTRWPKNVPIAYVISDEHKKVPSRKILSHNLKKKDAFALSQF